MPHFHKVNGDNITFYALPYYIGLIGFLTTLPSLIKTLFLRRKVERSVIFRVPGILSFMYYSIGMKRKHQYAAEVVGDPSDTFSQNASSSFLRPLIRKAFIHMLKKQCKNAVSIAYVTEKTLQKRYPPNINAFQTHYSSIQLSESDYYQRSNYSIHSTINVLCIGNLSQPYKGCDFMLKVTSEMKKLGQPIILNWIGGGQLLPDMKLLAAELEVTEQVNFIGNLSKRKDIIEKIDEADVFVLSSRQEGLPRVVIESMARSVICIATRVGGVPELIDNKFIFERDNIKQLIQQFTKFSKLTEKERLNISSNNYKKALTFKDVILNNRRKQMYSALLNTK